MPHKPNQAVRHRFYTIHFPNHGNLHTRPYFEGGLRLNLTPKSGSKDPYGIIPLEYQELREAYHLPEAPMGTWKISFTQNCIICENTIAHSHIGSHEILTSSGACAICAATGERTCNHVDTMLYCPTCAPLIPIALRLLDDGGASWQNLPNTVEPTPAQVMVVPGYSEIHLAQWARSQDGKISETWSAEEIMFYRQVLKLSREHGIATVLNVGEGSK